MSVVFAGHCQRHSFYCFQVVLHSEIWVAQLASCMHSCLVLKEAKHSSHGVVKEAMPVKHMVHKVEFMTTDHCE